MKILITGAEGQLGTALRHLYNDTGAEVFAMGKNDLDVTSRDQVFEKIKSLCPDIIINCAGFHLVEDAENNVDAAFQGNAFAAGWIAQAAESVSAKMVHVSTDYVFEGTKSEGYSEFDLPKPLNVHGASKLAGEHLVAMKCSRHYILRTSWVFGDAISAKKKNFVLRMIDKAKVGESIRVVDDQFGSPTYAKDLALVIQEVIQKEIPYGLYHATNSGFCSWYDFTKKIFEFTGMKVEVVPIKTDSSGSNVKRPKHSILLNNRLTEAGINKFRSWKDALSEYIDQLP
ncbi:MAG: dTDP-4-dehydrorhamnose reductase [Candidatus Magasanikbacteria bacterium]|nr:dTDP-4-dehydrorhamnose reductase [Candidatus Magasanikbacteria bacterium]